LPASRRASAIAIAPTAVLLIASASLILVSSYRLRASRDLALDTYEVISTASSLLSSVHDAEASQRGYLITERGEHLTLYQNAIGEIPKLVTRLRELTSDNPEQQRRIDALTDATNTELAELASTVDTLRQSGFASARAEITSRADHQTTLDIGRIVNEVIDEEQAILHARIAAADQTERRTLMVAVATMFAALIVLAIAQVLLVRRNTQLERADATAELKTALLQATLDHTREGIVAFNAQGRLLAFNQRFFEQLDLPKSLAVEGTSFETLLNADAVRVPAALLAARFRSPQRRSDEDAMFQSKIGARTVEIGAHATSDGGVLLSSVDVTQRVQAEAAAAQTQKMEAIGQLTGGVAHDFNNLLQIIRSNLDLLSKQMDEHPRLKQRIDNALAGVERAAQLTRQLLAFARRQPLEPLAVNLGRLVTEMSDLLRRTLGEHIEIETVVSGGLWNTLTDPAQIENALLNLAINARDAMPDGGKLTIELSNASLDDAYAARHADVTSGQYVLLAVTDTGAGMPPEVIARAFEPFFTTKPEGHGTGLGLAQVYGFVRQCGGHIKIYSEVGQGTTVKIYLPRTMQAQERDKPEMSEPIVGGTETILVVEDDNQVRRGAVDILGMLGYRVLQAASIEYALEMLEKGGRIDLLFTDVVMPGPLKSADLAKRAQELQPHIAVLFTSGYTENAIIHNRQLDPGVSLVGKPYRREDLARKVRAALDKTRATSPSVVGVESGSESSPVITPLGPKTPSPADALPSAAIARPAQLASPTSSLRVLVVEDDPVVRNSTMDVLAELGHQSVEAANGREALQKLDSEACFDLILTDIGLPDMGGEDLAAQCLKRQPQLRVIFATGYNKPPEGSDAGVPGVFLGKPFVLADLKRALETAMDTPAREGVLQLKENPRA
jgi:signal transduction histidine kinase/FixJ family two-component response regulator